MTRSARPLSVRRVSGQLFLLFQLQHGRGRGKILLETAPSASPRHSMSKNSHHRLTFHERSSNTVVVGGKRTPPRLRYRLPFLFSHACRRRRSGDSLSTHTVVVGGNYGRGRGKLRSWSGEITVVVGGNFPLETHTGAVSQIDRFLYLCSK